MYFGTRSGKLYGSANDGNRWSLIVDGLPPVTCVKAALVDGGSAKPKRRAPAKRTVKAAKRGRR